MTQSIPQYGRHDPAAIYVLRPGGYCVIRDGEGRVLLVETGGHLYLPGGGQEPGESLEEAAIRETREECGLRVRIIDSIGTADELIHSVGEGIHFRKRCSFFRAEIVEGVSVGNEPEHRILRVRTETALEHLRDGSQRWAVQAATPSAAFRMPPAMTSSRITVGLVLMAGLFLFGAVMCTLTILLLMVPGTPLDAVWRLNPKAHASLGEMGWAAIPVMAVVGGACAASAAALLGRQEWGRRIGILVLSVNLFTDLLVAVVRHDPRTLLGVPVAGAMILFLHRARSAFRATDSGMPPTSRSGVS